VVGVSENQYEPEKRAGVLEQGVTMDILCFSSSDWDGLWGSRQQVMLRFARKGHRVFYVEQLAGLEHFWRYPDLRARRRSNRQAQIREQEPNLWVFTPPVLLPGRYYLTAVTRLNAIIVRRWLNRVLNRFSIQDPILWLYKPEHAPLVSIFQNSLSVYHCIDDFGAGQTGRKKSQIMSLEAELLGQVDVVFANSELTFRAKKTLNPNTFRIPSGVDVEHFVQASGKRMEVHPEIASLPRPVLMFVGSLNEKIDVGLLSSLAGSHPGWSVVLVGPVFPKSVDLRELREVSNIHILGARAFSVLPSMLSGTDLCLLPYVQGEVTRYRSPLKLYEYLATGKPIVSVPHPEVNDFSGVIGIAPADRFVEAVEKALQNDNVEKQLERIALAKQHHWDLRVDMMEGIIRARLP